MRGRVKTVLRIAVLLLAAKAPAATAASYRFTNIADTSQAAPVGRFSYFPTVAAIQKSMVAFRGFFSNHSRDGVFTGDGGPLSTIVQAYDPAPAGVFHGVGEPVLGDGFLAFSGFYGDYDTHGIHKIENGRLHTIAQSGDGAPVGVFNRFEHLQASGDRLAFRGSYNDENEGGIFVSENGALQPVIREGDAAPVGVFRRIYDFDIMGSTIAFRGAYSDGFWHNVGLYRKTGDAVKLVIEHGDPSPAGPVVTVLDFAVSGESTVFVGLLGDYQSHALVLAGPDGVLTKIAATGDPAPGGAFGRFGGVAIQGTTVIFSAAYDDERTLGIFSFKGGRIEPILRTGDLLFGRPIVDLTFDTAGLDEGGSGNIAFGYLTDRYGIALALAVPEPPWISGVTAIAALSVMRLRRLSRS
jgi:hypothetical protein